MSRSIQPAFVTILSLVLFCACLVGEESRLGATISRCNEMKATLAQGVGLDEIKTAAGLITDLHTLIASDPASASPAMRSLLIAIFSAQVKAESEHPMAIWDESLVVLDSVKSNDCWADLTNVKDVEKLRVESDKVLSQVATWIKSLRLRIVPGLVDKDIVLPKLPPSLKRSPLAEYPDPSVIADESERKEYALELTAYRERKKQRSVQKHIGATIAKSEDIFTSVLAQNRNSITPSDEFIRMMLIKSGAPVERVNELLKSARK